MALTPPPLQQNELAILEFIHSLVETLDRYFENVVSAGGGCLYSVVQIGGWRGS